MFSLKNITNAPLPRKIAMFIIAITALSILPVGGGLLGLLQSLGIPIGFATPVIGKISVGFILFAANLWIFLRLAMGKMM